MGVTHSNVNSSGSCFGDCDKYINVPALIRRLKADDPQEEDVNASHGRAGPMSKKTLKALCEALHNNTHTHRLFLAHQQKVEGVTLATPLAAMLRVNTHLRQLDLVTCNLRDAGAQLLATALERQSTLEYLGVSGNEIGALGMQSLFLSLATMPQLTELDVSANEGVGGSFNALKELVQNTRTLIKLDLRNTHPTAAQLTGFAQVLAATRTPLDLDLSYWRSGSAGATALAEGLAHAECSVQRLVLQENDFKSGDMRILSPGLSANSSLRSLQLSANRFGHEGVIQLAEALRINCHLRTVSLCMCDTSGGDGTDARAVADALRNNLSVTELFHELYDGSANQVIRDCLARNSNLTVEQQDQLAQARARAKEAQKPTGGEQ